MNKIKGELQVKFLILLTIVLLCIPCFHAKAQASNPLDELRQLISELQNSPDNQSLREKIINLALTLDPQPTIPDEVATCEGAAEYAFKNAKTEADYTDAAKEYEKALLAAPWLAADYFNCGVAYEKGGNLDGAIRNFNYYLMAAPDAPDVIEVRKRIGGLKYAAEKVIKENVEKEAQQEAAEEKKKTGIEALAGNWRQIIQQEPTRWNPDMHWSIEVIGNELEVSEVVDTDSGGSRMGMRVGDRKPYAKFYKLEGHRLLGRIYEPSNAHQEGDRITCEVSDDFNELTQRYAYAGDVFFLTWRRDD
jgi:tetratricopeptide (TPR) repeat protein